MDDGTSIDPPPFPTSTDELTPELLTAVLAQRSPGVVVDDVEVAATKRAGEGIASTADRVLLDLRYAPGADAGLPGHMVLKTMLASPHAPAAMYENEVRFYLELRDGLAVEAPAAFGAAVDPGSGRFGLLMEDLTERGARFPAATDPVSLDEVRAVLDQLAAVHAAHWADPRFATDLAWVPTPLSGGMFEVFDQIGLALIEDQVARHPEKAERIAPLGRSVAELWDLLWQVQTTHTEEPTTLLHGDPHVGNTYLLPEGRAGLLDWQLMVRGSWAHDVTYLIVTALDPEVRRTEQHGLLRHYLDRLDEQGVAGAPDEDDALERMRRAALWGLVIGWLITPPENYGPEITWRNLDRVATAVEDLGTLAAIEGP